jgi:hypothetical protein
MGGGHRPGIEPRATRGSGPAFRGIDRSDTALARGPGRRGGERKKLNNGDKQTNRSDFQCTLPTVETTVKPSWLNVFLWGSGPFDRPMWQQEGDTLGCTVNRTRAGRLEHRSFDEANCSSAETPHLNFSSLGVGAGRQIIPILDRKPDLSRVLRFAPSAECLLWLLEGEGGRERTMVPLDNTSSVDDRRLRPGPALPRAAGQSGEEIMWR